MFDLQEYSAFLKKFDEKLNSYFKLHSSFVFCKKGCSLCCQKGDYPVSELELRYLMQGFLSLDNELKILVQKNFKSVVKGGKCPFLVNDECLIYDFRPIICRVHGLAYLYKDKKVKLPYCVNNGKNYSKVYENGGFLSQPIEENLDVQNVLKDIEYGEIRNLYDWINHS